MQAPSEHSSLVETTGRSRSVVVGEAIKSAEREAVLALASRQAFELREDPDDLVEMHAVARDMGPCPMERCRPARYRDVAPQRNAGADLRGD